MTEVIPYLDALEHVNMTLAIHATILELPQMLQTLLLFHAKIAATARSLEMRSAMMETTLKLVAMPPLV